MNEKERTGESVSEDTRTYVKTHIAEDARNSDRARREGFEVLREYINDKMAEHKANDETAHSVLTEKISTVIQVQSERDRLYGERAITQDASVATALEAVKIQTALSLASQGEVQHRAEIAQDRYNITHNDLLHKMDKQYEMMIPRAEFTLLHAELVHRVDVETSARMNDHTAVEREIATLREARSESVGEATARQSAANTAKWLIGTVGIAAVALLVNLVHYWLAVGAITK